MQEKFGIPRGSLRRTATTRLGQVAAQKHNPSTYDRMSNR
jgi:hypothetical protein